MICILYDFEHLLILDLSLFLLNLFDLFLAHFLLQPVDLLLHFPHPLLALFFLISDEMILLSILIVLMHALT
jgi:hypothetical protein